MGSSAAIRARTIETDRLRMHTLEAGPDDGEPVVLIHGNLSSGRFFDNLMAAAPERYHLVAPDMRSFGRSEPVPIDATRGVRDWADDTAALVAALGIDRPVHLAGWSTGGAAAAMYAIDRPVASLTLIDPVSPFGFGGTRPDGSPYFADHCGSGGGTGNPEFTALLAKGDRSTDSMFSPRNILNASYWSFSHKEPPEHEDLLLDEVLLSVTGDDGYPGDLTPSEHWPGFAPGTRGILNALSSKYCNWSGLVDVDPRPPVLWTHGTDDIVIADGSAWDIASLGQAGAIPGWPGADVFPPQLMVTQIRGVLDRYRDAGGRVEVEMFEGSGHFPVLDAAERWHQVFFDFLASV